MLEGLIGSINNFDYFLFYLINVNMNNYILTLIMPIITEFGVMEYWVLGCGLLYFVGYFIGEEKAKITAILCFIAILLSFYGVEILKMVFERPRPFIAHHGVNLLVSVGPSLFGMTNYSFPSGHSAVIFAACTILGKKYGYLPLFMAFACLVGFSRIYIGVHYPLDVIFGALVGILCAFLVLRFQNNILSNYNSLKEHIIPKR